MSELVTAVLIALIFIAMLFTGSKKDKASDYWIKIFGGDTNDIGYSVQ